MSKNEKTERKHTSEFYVGLDMGTNSVGWAVTDPEYRLLRAKGKDLWGARLFDRAKTAEERRGYRVARRRRQRETARLGVLQEYFSDEIGKTDPGFFRRLEESKYFLEDRSLENKQPYALFSGKDYTDKDYYRDYPTIFHLRKELIENKQPHDVRLVYLALANMFKRRGHFLNTSLDTEDTGADLKTVWLDFAENASEYGIELPQEIDFDKMEEILGDRTLSRKKMLEAMSILTGITKKAKAAYELLSMICGLSGKIINIYGDQVIDEENKKLSLGFRDSNYDDSEIKVRECIGDEYFELLESVKMVHDTGLLINIMKGQKYLSMARVELYEQHKKDLRALKDVLKKYDRNAYHDMFRVMEDGNYSDYIGSVNSSGTVIRRSGSKKRNPEDLYKKIKAALNNLPEEAQNDPCVTDIREKLENQTFLPKQLTSANGVIPNQIHAREMKAILRNAESYLPFLKETDESGLTVSERILKLFSFQIPYYVGPLGQQYLDQRGYNVWARRIEPGKIYPWNLEEKIDVKEAAEKFINRMVRHCTYLTGETALPKNALLYEKFTVLNELNNLRIHGEKLKPELKQKIYKELFLKGKRVSQKGLESYLKANGIIEKNDTEAISGIDNGFNNSLSSVGKFRGILGDAALYEENQKMIEDIIFWATVYGNDKKFLRERITESYKDNLDEAAVRRIAGFKFDGWGNLSKSFLEMKGTSRVDGTERSLIMALWETDDNLMELLSDKYTYRDTLASMTEEAEKPLSEWTAEDLDDMYLSAPVKRMIWQTLRVLNEVQLVMKGDPKRIFVEMPREDNPENKGKRTVSRKNKLSDLYKKIKEEGKDWNAEIEQKDEHDFRSKKLYLYYLQKGRCMYSGERISLDDLSDDNLYDIDHIYPRHFIKDDSLENNLVLVKKQINAHKSDTFPLESEIRRSQYGFWKELKNGGFITEEKFKRLTRQSEFTDEEKAAFISRQLVETRQGTKAVTQILKQAFPDTKIVFSKAGLVSDFRNKYGMPKVRCVNDLHHAADAYLNIVVGNTYFVKFTNNPLHFIQNSRKNPGSSENHYNMDRIFDFTVQRNGETAWIASKDGQTGTLPLVKKTLKKNSPLITRRSYLVYGAITNKATIYGAETAKEEGYIPVKMSDERLQDVTKYGGLTSIANAGYVLIEYSVKGKKKRCLEAVPVYLGEIDKLTDEKLLAYFNKTLPAENKGKEISGLRICYKPIRYKSLVRIDGYYYYLAGKTGVRICLDNGVPLYLNSEMMKYAKKLEKAVTTDNYMERDKKKELILTRERNGFLYQDIVDKLENTIYQYRKNSILNIMKTGKTQFEELPIEVQCKVMMQIMGWFQLANFLADLEEIGGSAKSGIALMNKNIAEVKEFILFNQSPTGLFQSQIDLLSV